MTEHLNHPDWILQQHSEKVSVYAMTAGKYGYTKLLHSVKIEL